MNGGFLTTAVETKAVLTLSSLVGWRCGVQILFQRLACCADDSQSIGGYAAWVHHLTHCCLKLIAESC